MARRVLNLYAGIGGNREPWRKVSVTAVEADKDIAEVYMTRFPEDRVIVSDASAVWKAWDEWKDFDFIWASPPCQTHGQYRHNVGVRVKGYAPVMPDMTGLYGTIVFLREYFGGKWCVENTVPYYEPLISPTAKIGRHLFWSNFDIQPMDVAASGLRSKNAIAQFKDAPLVTGSRIKNKRQALRNCVDPLISAHILNCAFRRSR